MNRKELIDWIWLSETIGRSGFVFRKLLSRFDHPNELYAADEETIRKIPNLTERNIAALLNKDQSAAVKILDDCERLGVSVVPYNSKVFPQILHEIPDPPALLYVAGKIPDFENRFCVAMVGTRKMSEAGMQNAYRLSRELSDAGALIVSGLAEGIDGVCAVGAMQGGGGTVAVIGCGLDIAYPAHHGKLMNRIVESGGAILSEYPPGTPPSQYHFPVRNRIISGLSQIVIVVEAGMSSGSLITAREAFTQGKKVFTIPADLETHTADGNNKLLQDGAQVVLESRDLLERFRYVFKNRPLADRIHPLLGGADRDALRDLGVIGFERTPHSSGPKPKKTLQEPKRENGAAESVETEAERKTPSVIPDEVLQSLDPVQLAVLEAMPDDYPVVPEKIQAGYPLGEVMAALTVLEILGIVRKLPGSMYGKI
ncbi:MAG: DNA-protecting protein DprA [Ruminococcaceae bacterium]|nr:DNA-protecting protein DprA [Oscillospiraceae bacterium]